MWLLVLLGCSEGFRGLLWDRCEELCVEVGDSLTACGASDHTWADLGSQSEEDYVRTCRGDWSDLTTVITSRELELGLDTCEVAREELASLSCEEIWALYAPSTWE
ncbi:MAG: hypothetical protein JXX28_13405 [Deltaproteobacteria bacterium]|nr:hypothetical protein [Deltaproteobacteria bacterium]